MTTYIMMIHDIVEKNGKTIRENNFEKRHAIPIGTLVQLETGARAFVVFYGRDCDQTPLYYLSLDADDTEEVRAGWRNPGWIGGYSEEGLTVVT